MPINQLQGQSGRKLSEPFYQILAIGYLFPAATPFMIDLAESNLIQTNILSQIIFNIQPLSIYLSINKLIVAHLP